MRFSQIQHSEGAMAILRKMLVTPPGLLNIQTNSVRLTTETVLSRTQRRDLLVPANTAAKESSLYRTALNAAPNTQSPALASQRPQYNVASSPCLETCQPPGTLHTERGQPSHPFLGWRRPKLTMVQNLDTKGAISKLKTGASKGAPSASTRSHTTNGTLGGGFRETLEKMMLSAPIQ